MEIYGENFACPNNNCDDIKVRFTHSQNGDVIFVDGNMTESGSVICTIPKYPAPEIFDVDVTFNDHDYTNNGVKFGFHDPFVEDVFPKLISTSGNTKINMVGYGFVQ